MAKGYSSGYGKRPFWQWILLYVIVGCIIYAAIYYFVLAKNGSYNYNTTTNSAAPAQDTPSLNY